MQLKKMKLFNFANFSNFECEFNGKITHLVGMNGAGKTTIGLTALWAGLKGIAENSKSNQLIGERFRFIGNSAKSADIELTLFDEIKKAEIKVKNHITKDSNKITFDAPEGYTINNDWLNNLLSVAFLSAKNFTQLNSKDQALLLGINVDTFDKELKIAKEEYTIINRELKNIGELKDVQKVEKVSVSELVAEKTLIDTFNSEQEKKVQKKEKYQTALNGIIKEKENLEIELQRINDKLTEIQCRIENGKKEIESLPLPKDKKEIQSIVDKIAQSEIINNNAILYNQYIENKIKKEIKEKELESNKTKQQGIINKRLEYIKSFNFGFDGLAVNDDGELLLKDRPIKEPYFSKGEFELIVARLYKSLKPELKIRFIDDFEALDEINQEKIVKELLDEGFQIITAEVGENSLKENTILLRECKIIDNNDNSLIK